MNKKTLLKIKEPKTINFDVDDTLIKQKKDVPIKKNITLLKKAVAKGHKVKVWSRNGKDYSKNVGKRIGLKGVTYASKNVKHKKPDIAVDDRELNLGKQNIMV